VRNFTLRTEESELAYANSKEKKSLDQEDKIREWDFWYLINNRFPYDTVAEVHHLLLPRSGRPMRELHNNEWDNFYDIIDELGNDYSVMMWNFPRQQSVKNLLHYHLVRYKRDR
jgi:hypothetical protein